MKKLTSRRRRTTSRPASLRVRKRIDAKQQDLAIVSAEAWRALQDSNEPPYLFVFVGAPIRLVERGADDVALEVLTVDKFRYELARVADWVVNTSHGRTSAMPPKDVVHDMLAHPAHPLPELSRITHSPVFVPGPRLLNVPGYDPESQTYYAQPACLVDLEVPSRPSRDAVTSARRFLLEELLGDFPLVADSDRAHALCLQVLPFVRPVIDGATPLHLVEKPKERTGAGLLVDILLFPATGGSTAVMTLGTQENETRRTLTARLASSPAAILIDNATDLQSAALAAAITAPVRTLKFCGIRTIYISQQIDSDNEQAETLLTVHGLVDGLYIQELSKKVKRGLLGQLDRGYHTGSRTYGYRTTPVYDPSGKRDVDGPVMVGKQITI